MSYGKKLKTEHAGAKNGGGSYGHREDVKKQSRRKRRRIDQKLSAESQKMLERGIEDVKAGRVRQLPLEELEIGYEACWKELEGGGHCRMPKGHEGGCAGA